MNVLIACECSGITRVAFQLRGHNAYSCDLKPDELYEKKNHYQCDVRKVLYKGWDLLVAHPPCTHLSFSGERWITDKARFPNKEIDRELATSFFMMFVKAPINKICIENPFSVHINARYKPATQKIQPWMFGHAEKKETHLWLKNLPSLIPTDIVELGEDANRIHFLGGGHGEERSVSYTGIAKAMATQWG